MSKYSESQLIQLARDQLKWNKTRMPPSSYLHHLVSHLDVFPNDYNFFVSLQPGHAFGQVMCNEQGCNALVINLTPDPMAVNGGRDVGFGTLRAYQGHVESHPTHANARARRVQVQLQVSAKHVSKPHAPSSQTAQRSLAVKKEMQDPQSPLRSSSPPMLAQKRRSIADGDAREIPKKPKLEPMPPQRAVLSQRTNFTLSDVKQEFPKPEYLKPDPYTPALLSTQRSIEAQPADILLEYDARKREILANIERLTGAIYRGRPPDNIREELTMRYSELEEVEASIRNINDSQTQAMVQHVVAGGGSAQNLGAYLHSNAVPGPSGTSIPTYIPIPHRDYPNIPPEVQGVALDPTVPMEVPDAHGQGYLDARRPYHAAEDLNAFIRGAGNWQSFEENVTVNGALKELQLPDLNALFPGTRISLMPHQVLGVAWMVRQEAGRFKGGILADEMGLGKTVQTAALIVKNRSNDPAHRSVLIVAPLALLRQWEDEILSKTTLDLRVLIYHGSSKPKGPRALEELQTYDVVLTTFQTLAIEWPETEDFAERRKKRKAKTRDDFIVHDSGSDSEGGPRRQKKAPNQGLLFKATDLATRRLQAIFRSCLLRRKKDSELDGRRLIELPKKTVNDTFLMFSKEERDIYNFVQTRSRAVFNKFLRQGTVLKNYAQVLVMLLRLRQCAVHPSLIAEFEDAFLRDGEIRECGVDDSDRANELRRAVEIMREAWVREVRESLKNDALERLAAEKKSVDASIVEECPICIEVLQNPLITPCKHVFCSGCIEEVFSQPVDDENAQNPDERPCPTCRTRIHRDHLFLRAAFEPTDIELGLVEPPVTFAPQALKGKRKAKVSKDTDDEFDGGPDSPDEDEDYSNSRSRRRSGRQLKRKAYGVDSDDELDDFIVQDGESETEKDRKRDVKRRAKNPKKGKGKMRIDSDDDYECSEAEEDEVEEIVDNSIDIAKYDYLASLGISDGTRPPPMMAKFVPSTKMLQMMAILEDIRENHPDDKVIIVSQWTSALDLCAGYLAEKKFTFVRYQGSMNPQEREHAVRGLMYEDEVRVMLLSLKAGGVGLNLTGANRVISLDFAWSEAVEAQAFDRTHRLGQKKEVVIERLAIDNTVEGRVIGLQQKKKSLADGSLGEGGAKMGRMTVRELAGLFGLNIHGEVIDN
ncbi:hypothetical protein FRB99_007551 [Tulasnella sp. 403]|nr:hypothetical protein FRB99_007551 [Tulasnella sp. 403]